MIENQSPSQVNESRILVERSLNENRNVQSKKKKGLLKGRKITTKKKKKKKEKKGENSELKNPNRPAQTQVIN